jgi:hypothetical protein
MFAGFAGFYADYPTKIIFNQKPFSSPGNPVSTRQTRQTWHKPSPSAAPRDFQPGINPAQPGI